VGKEERREDGRENGKAKVETGSEQACGSGKRGGRRESDDGISLEIETSVLKVPIFNIQCRTLLIGELNTQN
jgi:hypothetical protein